MSPALHYWTTGSFRGGPPEGDAPGMRPLPAGDPPASGEQRASSARLRVLVVEPAAVLRNIMAHALSVQGYEVRAVEGLTGLTQRMAVFDPHLLVSEATLPDGSGEQVCSLAQAHGGKLVPVILMSGQPESELEARAKATGADRHFCKARGLSQLLDLVEELTSEILF